MVLGMVMTVDKSVSLFWCYLLDFYGFAKNHRLLTGIFSYSWEFILSFHSCFVHFIPADSLLYLNVSLLATAISVLPNCSILFFDFVLRFGFFSQCVDVFGLFCWRGG